MIDFIAEKDNLLAFIQEHPTETAVTIYLLVSTVSLLRSVLTKRKMALLTQLMLFASSFVAGAIFSAQHRPPPTWLAVSWLILSGVWLAVSIQRYRREHPPAKKIPAAAK